MNKDKIHISVFSTGERTEQLALYAINYLGFKNVNLISDHKTSFAEKFKEFVETAYENIDNYDYFLRSDADEIIYDNVFNFINEAIKNKEFLFAHGFFIDAYMKKPRGGGPKLFSKKAIMKMRENICSIKECTKPESYFIKLVTDQKYPYFMTIYEATCLHEYEQHPSKVANSFLNRLKRNHAHLYNLQELLNRKDIYENSFQHAIKVFEDNSFDSNSSKFLNMNFLDTDSYQNFLNVKKDIPQENFETIYEKLRIVFNHRKTEVRK